MKTCFVNCRVILEDRVAECAVVTEHHKIIYVGTNPNIDDDVTVIDGKGSYLSPGFVDIHVHGGGGFGVMNADADAICQMCETHLKHGTTSILPTTLASPIPLLQKAIAAVKKASEKQIRKTILGIHLEGSFLSPSQKGAQSEDSILPITTENITDLLDTWDGIRMVGAAPEIPNIELLAKELKKRGITMTVAHSDASFLGSCKNDISYPGIGNRRKNKRENCCRL